MVASIHLGDQGDPDLMGLGIPLRFFLLEVSKFLQVILKGSQG